MSQIDYEIYVALRDAGSIRATGIAKGPEEVLEIARKLNGEVVQAPQKALEFKVGGTVRVKHGLVAGTRVDPLGNSFYTAAEMASWGGRMLTITGVSTHMITAGGWSWLLDMVEVVE